MITLMLIAGQDVVICRGAPSDLKFKGIYHLQWVIDSRVKQMWIPIARMQLDIAGRMQDNGLKA